MNLCQQCGAETINPKFCNLSCAGKYQKGKRSRTMHYANCLTCDSKFVKHEREQKFCSRSCSAKTNNKIRKKNVADNAITHTIDHVKICIYCKTNFSSKRPSQEFCSVRCSIQYRNDEKITMWLKGEWSGNAQCGLSRIIRNYLLAQANYACSECGWNKIHPTLNRSPLEIDHIDGNCYNNSKENLRVICPNCHALSPNFRALNKQSNRTYRKKYYDAGVV